MQKNSREECHELLGVQRSTNTTLSQGWHGWAQDTCRIQWKFARVLQLCCEVGGKVLFWTVLLVTWMWLAKEADDAIWHDGVGQSFRVNVVCNWLRPSSLYAWITAGRPGSYVNWPIRGGRLSIFTIWTIWVQSTACWESWYFLFRFLSWYQIPYYSPYQDKLSLILMV